MFQAYFLFCSFFVSVAQAPFFCCAEKEKHEKKRNEMLIVQTTIDSLLHYTVLGSGSTSKAFSFAVVFGEANAIILDRQYGTPYSGRHHTPLQERK